LDKKVSEGDDFTLLGLNIKSIKWNALTESADLEDFDIGIIPFLMMSGLRENAA